MSPSKDDNRKHNKRDVSGPLRLLLDWDVKATNVFCNVATKVLPMSDKNLRAFMKGLELSGHGIPWFCGSLAFTWLFSSREWHELTVNLLLGLILDLIVIAFTKAGTRRRRPSGNRDDMFATYNVDKFSFPSGHASRAVMVALLFTFLWPLPLVVRFPIYNWVIALCMSRVVLRRHHILDVLGGVAIGYLEYFVLSLLWIGGDQAQSIVAWLTDEKLDGGDYHV